MPVRPGRLMASILAIAVALSLSGCAGSTGHPSGAPETGSLAPDVNHGLTVLRTAKGDAMMHDAWANGTVAFQDSCNTGGCARERSVSFRVTDITEQLPAGMPVRIEASVEYAPHPLYGAVWELTIEAPGSSVYAYTHSLGQGEAVANATLLADGKVTVTLAIFQPGGGIPDTPYSLRIRISSDPVTLLPGVPVGLELRAGDNVSADVPFLLYAPDGHRIGRFFKLHQVPADSPTGQYSLLLLPEGAPSPVSSSRGGALKTLALRYEPGPLVTVPQEGVLDQTWDVRGAPVGMGIRIFTQPGISGQNVLATMGVNAKVSGPNGFGLEALACGGLCLAAGQIGWDLSWRSPLGDDRVTAGAYTLHLDSHATYDVHAQPFAVYATP
ncbi:MAG TPA: hypothetical protein VM327_00550 [Candidatus Thermoplasmatota archaeon]|nr:hypothetical protein [Candidatus Thermoplasmatota archaeon]